MASFQVHVDQENQVKTNTRHLRSKSTIPNGRSVLGIINNNSRLPIRSSKNEEKDKLSENAAATAKVKSSTFTVHQDSNNPKQETTKVAVGVKNKSSAFPLRKNEERLKPNENNKKVVSSTVTSKPVLTSTTNNATAATTVASTKPSLTENKLALPVVKATDIDQHRQPLKDLKITVEEESMSEGSFIENSELSPMVIDRSLTLTVTPPSLQTKPQKQREVSSSLYDMEEYREEIFQYLKKAETRHRPKSCYMLRQPDVTYSMRAVLVDWLVEVAEEYKLHTETLYLAVSFIDRFLSVMSVVRGKLQLLGTAAMFIASKYEEIYPPELNEFVYITDDTYTKSQVLRMEHLILKVLKFDISVPTPLAFLNHIKVECKLTEKNIHLAMYLCELSLLEGDPYIQYLPSLIACAAIAVARYCLEYEEIWTDQLSRATGYTLEQLAPCISHFNDTHSKASSLQYQAVTEKYKANKWHNASEITPRQLTVAATSS